MAIEDVLTDDQSHYEVSLTAGQAFLAFVLLLLSLAASFAFGLLLGRGQGDDRSTARKQDATIVNEVSSAPAKASAREVAVKDDDFKATTEPPPTVTEEKTPVWAPASAGAVPAKAGTHTEAKASVEKLKSEPDVPHFAQLLSTSDQKTAETLAAKLIDAGFTSSYVERTITEKGTVYRVRTKFPSEAEARAAEAKLKTFSKDVWITK
ncbi:MAG TPA: SPOR domain-containing protein [Thermoanaerobaculia bacterium]